MRYQIDPRGSRFSVKAFAGGPLSGMGHNPSFDIRDLRGEVTFDPATPATASLKLVAGAASLSLTGNTSEKDRKDIERVMQNDVLEIAKYPDVTYTCPASKASLAGEGQVTLNGDLTLHGVTRPVTVAARIYPSGDSLRGQGEASIRQTDFGIKLVTVAGGLLKVKDEVKLTFDIVARLAEDRQPVHAT